MKRIAITIIHCIFASYVALAQLTNSNYVMTETMLDNTEAKKITSIQFYDMLGRPSQTATNGLGSEGKYVYTLKQYDGNGRESIAWLPVKGNASLMQYAPTAFSGMASATYGTSSYTYSTTEYDALNRPVFVSTPGNLWHAAGKGKQIEYLTNEAGSVKSFSVSDNGTIAQSYYPAGTLTCERTTDEDRHAIAIYKNLLGNVVLERRNDGTGNNDTHYAYDSASRLRYVLPPKCTSTSADMLSKYAYKYEYDSHGNCSKKTLPGCEYVQYWYDSADRLAFMQDSRLRSASKYRFYLYDQLGRLAVQGVCGGSLPLHVDWYPATVGYEMGSSRVGSTPYKCQTAYSFSNPEIEIVNFYDSYNFLSSTYTQSVAGSADLSNSSHANATSLLTGQIVSASNGSMLCSAFYYDEKGNMIDARETQQGGALLKTETTYSFTNKPEVSTVTLLKNGVTRTVVQTNEYDDHSDKLISQQHKYGTRTAVTTAHFTYDDLGRMSALHQHNGAIATTYGYDLHGWTTDIQSNVASSGNQLFSEKLLYADASVNPCYNGNISESRWQTAANGSSYRYRYTYDGMDRMTAASFHAGGSISQSSSTAISDIGNVSVAYDVNSNIHALTRRGKLDNGYGIIDNLTYTHSGNQLLRIDDSASPIVYEGSPDFKNNAISTPGYEYAYDGCGAMTYDANKGITKIEYDLLGNPKKISFADRSYIDYVYTADGRRLKTRHYVAVPSSTTLSLGQESNLTSSQIQSKHSTDYIGSFVFENNAFKQYHFEGGYITSIGTPTYYKYYVKDHLGNNRILASYNGTVEQTNHYYPFGSTHHFSSNQGVQKYKYNGKELDTMHGLNMYDYGARQYDPAIGQFTSMDPLCEKYYHISPYAYCGGNPVNRVDVDGDSIAIVMASKGAYGFGHMAVLVQNTENSWTYYSKNGHTRTNNDGTNTEDVYESVDAFLESHIGYDKCFVIHDEKSEEKEADRTAKETVNRDYSTFVSNCAQFVQNVLRAAGVKDGSHGTTILPSQTNMMDIIANQIVPKYIYSNILMQNTEKGNRYINKKK